MRKFILLLSVIVFICACVSSTPEVSNTVDLDTAIQISSKEISDALASGTKVALLNFSSSSDMLSDYVLEEMSISLVKGRKLVVVDRKEIDLIRREMNFQMSGEVSEESAQEIGRLLGAQSIVSGSLISIGESYRFRTKLIDVNSAAIQTSSSISVRDEPQIQYMLAQGPAVASPAPQAAARAPSAPSPAVQGGVVAIPAQAVSEPLPPAAPAENDLKAYKIGDTGPAGGLIFYDKGNNSGGWRYLEAAPVEAEFQAAWSAVGSFGTSVENTQEGIGSGKRNTQLIVEMFRKTTGEWDTAAQQADELVFNGFDDWFLPSKAELDQMYGNLKRKNLGDFKDEYYWSSTDDSTSQNFKDGGRITHWWGNGHGKRSKDYVRPIRQVAGPNTARSEALPYDEVPVSGGGGTKAASGSRATKFFTTLLAVLLLGGAAAYIIWTAPSRSGA